MKILLAYFSFTGNTEKVGNLILNFLKQKGINCALFTIEPVFKLPYLLWLFLSFVPGLPFPLKNLKLLKLYDYDVVILGTPKWTFNCPPATSFIRFVKKSGRKFKIGIFLTYGGFKEDVYLERLKNKFVKDGYNVIAVQKFKRRDIQDGFVMDKVEEFCLKIIQSI